MTHPLDRQTLYLHNIQEKYMKSIKNVFKSFVVSIIFLYLHRFLVLGQLKVAMIMTNHLIPTSKLCADSPYGIKPLGEEVKGWV